MGYPIMDAIDRHPVIVEENVKWLKEIAYLKLILSFFHLAFL